MLAYLIAALYFAWLLMAWVALFLGGVRLFV